MFTADVEGTGFKVFCSKVEHHDLLYVCFANKWTLMAYHGLFNADAFNKQIHLSLNLLQIENMLLSCFQAKTGYQFLDFNFNYTKAATIVDIDFCFLKRKFSVSLTKDLMKEEILNFFLSYIKKPFVLYYNCLEIGKSADLFLEFSPSEQIHLVLNEGGLEALKLKLEEALQEQNMVCTT
jgi:hypothetical protein